jgi:TatD DNase family protein
VRLFDSHCHFETEDADTIAAILARAAAAGVEKIVAVGGSDTLNAAALAAQRIASTRRFPEVQVALGYDREQINQFRDFSTLQCLPWLKNAVAIGEIGLDYHYAPETRDAQRALFAAQLDFARQNDKPVVIHTREAADDTIGHLKEIPSRGVIHCFTGEPSEARAYLDLGFYVSISGIVTFKAADNVRATARTIPDDRILIETDSPYLAPVPLRGRPNEPAFIRHTCEFLASERGLSPAKFAEMTFLNAERAFS